MGERELAIRIVEIKFYFDMTKYKLEIKFKSVGIILLDATVALTSDFYQTSEVCYFLLIEWCWSKTYPFIFNFITQYSGLAEVGSGSFSLSSVHVLFFSPYALL